MEIKREVPLETTCYENGKESFDITSSSLVSLTAVNAGEDKAVVRGHVTLSFRGFCDRCLTEVPVALALNFERTILSPETRGKDDCKGICPVCGQNLNEKECGCDTFVPDPRMAVIQDIFKNKEV